VRLFHFSEDPHIQTFVPRPVEVPSARRPGEEWLNGPLVWAVSEERQATYLFPRDCPRVLLWRTPATTPADEERWLGDRTCSMIAHVEWRWLEVIRDSTLYRYELPPDGLEPLTDDGWMSVALEAVEPVGVEPCGDLLAALAAQDVELRLMPSLVPLRDVWSTTLHASGIRLRHATGW
jgi:hypothetical protein